MSFNETTQFADEGGLCLCFIRSY